MTTLTLVAAAELAKKTDSILLALLVVLTICLIAAIPLFKTLSKMRLDRDEIRLRQENRMLLVIERNSDVNASLKTLIEISNKQCVDCQGKQLGLFRRMFDHQNEVADRLQTLSDKSEVHANRMTKIQVEDYDSKTEDKNG